MLPKIITRCTQPRDFAGITEMCLAVYPETRPWRKEQLASHLRVFPEGQFVAVEEDTQRVVGMAASLVLRWDDYHPRGTWKDFTDHGMFTNHDLAHGKTLYGAEIMVDPRVQRRGVGSRLYKARRGLVERLQLRRIRAAARLRGYHRYASQMSAEEYTIKVVRGEIKGPTLSFQLKHGFEVIAVVSGYLKNDPESMGYAAIIEWLNARVAQPADYAERDPRFLQIPRRRI